MEQLIEQLQQAIKDNNGLSKEEKESYFVRLELMKDLKGSGADEMFGAAIKKVLEQPDKVKEFFTGMDNTMRAYIEGGAQGLIKNLDEVTKE